MTSSSVSVSATPENDLAGMLTMDADYTYDPNDPAQIVAHSTEVLVATVKSVAPSTSNGFPATRAVVEVVSAIKGQPAGEITVVQQLGRNSSGRFVGVAGDSPLKTDRMYVLFTTGDDRAIIPVYGNTLLRPEEAARVQSGGDTSEGTVAKLRKLSEGGEK